MKNKNKINLNIDIIEELKKSSYEGIKSKYAPLFLNVIIANNNFPNELKDCILDHNMLEYILLESDFNFLIKEFGKDITEFPEEFQKACIVLHEEFKKDFPKASTYESDLQYFYHKSEFDDIKIPLRELISEFTYELGIEANLQSFIVYANCIKSEEKFILRLEMYVREKNNFPHIFESRPFLNAIDQTVLKQIEQYYEWLAISEKWGNKIDYLHIMITGHEMRKFIPDFSLVFPSYFPLNGTQSIDNFELIVVE